MNNILLNQIIYDDSSYTFKECIPIYENTYVNSYVLTTHDGSIFWSPIDVSINGIVNNHFKNTDIYYDSGRLGLGRFPMFNYKIDLAVPKNTLMTAFHIGDGSFGFSLGNGTSNGFIPEIIGVGSSQSDAGLYLVGVAGNDNSSNIPLIILDGRNTYSEKLTNRPILGITSGNYNEYIVKVELNSVIIKGKLAADDMMLNNISLLDKINDLEKQIEELKTKLT